MKEHTCANSAAKQTQDRDKVLRSHAKWLKDAVFYEIYPQSFKDSNGDGTGDLRGIIEKLDYVRDLGCNVIWLNPIYDSPFKDAGYDVRDYLKVAPRYGTNEDAFELFRTAHDKGIKILLDLVPGHTSEEHEWFKASCKAENNEFSGRYIWTNDWIEGAEGLPFIGGEAERSGTYVINFFKCQPALNYGFGERKAGWMMSADDEEPLKTREAIVDVMRFWLNAGADGFRVDMADSLVKFDGFDKKNTIKVWQDILFRIKSEFPKAAFVSEWGRPRQALRAGFDMDFYLDWRWGGNPNGYCMLLRDTDDRLTGLPEDSSYLVAKSGSSPVRFLNEYLPQYEETKDLGSFCFLTCNHDTARLAPRLDARERAVALTLLFALPGHTFLYYGDEIGMEYRKLPTKEGGYVRTGSRTPMQWSNEKNAGFSKADSAYLYLPVPDRGNYANVASQINDPKSQYSLVKSLIRSVREIPALAPDSEFKVLYAQESSRSLVFARFAKEAEKNGFKSVIVALNPSLCAETVQVDLSDVPNTNELNSADLNADSLSTIISVGSDVSCSNALSSENSTMLDITIPAQSAAAIGLK